MKRLSLFAASLAALLVACGDDTLGTGGAGAGGSNTGGSSTTTGTAGSGASAGSGATGGSTATGGSGTGGSGGSVSPPTLDELLDALRADLDAALLAQSNEGGWPAPVEGGWLFVNTDLSLDKVAGDHDNWAGTALTPDQGFSWAVIASSPGDRYKFTDLTTYVPDPWARSYTYDEFGEMTLVEPPMEHLDRFFRIAGQGLGPRTVRALVPATPITHVLYTHDGQNLFDPDAFFGGWKIQDTAPENLLVVGIDNTPARMDEYTHVQDVIGGDTLGGLGDAYADFLQLTVRPLVAHHYGEPAKIGTMGSSLGGLISFHVADRYPGEYAFAASLSGTMGWGSIGSGVHNETIIERYAAHGHQGTVLYLDSGGDGGACDDSDNDGVDDDLDEGDNYCENAQLHGVLQSAGYTDDADLFYVFSPGAQHNEAEWASRVSVPMQIFMDL